MRRSFWKIFTTIYWPTLALLIIVQLSFYFPDDNIQVRATVTLSCFLILSALLSSTEATPNTSGMTLLQIWILFAVTLTFSDIALQVVVGYLRIQAKKIPVSNSKVNDVMISIQVKTEKSKRSQELGQRAEFLNFYGGKVLSPFFVIVFTLVYFTYAFSVYYEPMV